MPRKPADPDSADDLFGRPPRDPALCPGCGRLAEPFEGDTCWSCTQDLKLAVKRLPNGAGRKPRESRLPRSVSPVYTPVVAGGR